MSLRDDPARSDGQRDRPAGGVVQRLGAIDPAAPRIATREPLEVDERIAGGGQATAAGRARHRAQTTVADGSGAKLGIGRVDHGNTSRTGIGLDGEDDASTPG
jgi:hypothetical protein